ncbi:sensor histidine kinase [Paenibacillus sp. N3/727]|uniref:histidine kinase N-terminal domain-containing protein n=1 Tax=Paenibacillus sp. N3/727 TaxID=2925845 RepID=UPI001F53BA56|nr:histidine kinase N-terminal domain-containing protein [Paenibacillus sp. N3/727]UNK20759.1 sensor histidine kinase [Paenibacillus sp. N3/727]
MNDFKEEIAYLCKRRTGLSDADIVRITEMAESFEMSAEQDDGFIDVLSCVENEAIVVYPNRSDTGNSLYERSIVSESALRENEYGVLHSIIDQLEDAVLIFDKDGFVKLKNLKADVYYRRLGYLEDIQELHYDHLSLDQTTFSGVMKEYYSSPSSPIAKVVKIASCYYQVKRIFIVERDFLVCVIIHDVTEIKEKEAQIISNSAAIREIHHRVKNNLQTVASLLRIQGRQSENLEVKRYLNDSVSRVLAIATTHELLSKEIESHVDLLDILQLVSANIQRCFVDYKNIHIEITAEQSIYLDSDRSAAIALIVNELLQNSCEHAFEDGMDGMITVNAQMEGDLVTMKVADNGNGFSTSDGSYKSLGLSIVHSYVKDKLKGKLVITSSGDGTTVAFAFKK